MPTMNGSQASGPVAGFESVLISPVLSNAWSAFPPVFHTHPTGQLLISTTNGQDTLQEWHLVRELVCLHGQHLVIIATDVYVFVVTAAECGVPVTQPVASADIGNACAPAPPRLTRREQEVLQALARGCTNKAIADHLIISESTVKTHVERPLRKFEVRSRHAAVVAARHTGVLQGC